MSASPSSLEERQACKVRLEYAAVKDMPPPALVVKDAVPLGGAANGSAPSSTLPSAKGLDGALGATPDGKGMQMVAIAPQPAWSAASSSSAKLLSQIGAAPETKALAQAKPSTTVAERYMPSAQVMKRLPSKWPKPVWHPPWKNYRVISGHLGWVRSVAFEPANEWFCTGSADRTIKIWETATGKLKLTLTGHIEQIRGLAVSPRHPYMFSAGDDKMVKCWDLEYNKVIRSYHGHLSGVYCLALHPMLDVLMTGGRDSVCRVWDMRTKAQVFALSGHESTVCAVITQGADPQVVTGSHDTTIKLWDLAAGKTMSTLTFHKKSVRALAMHPFEHTFASASADNVKKFRLPKGEFLHNMLSQQRTIVNCMAINEDNVMVSGGDNGSVWCWDWKSGHNYQQAQTVVQPGSLDSEAGIYALSFDMTGSRLVTCEADKTIKMWKEDTTATPETHPVHFRPPKDIRRF
eukprot:SM000011S19038  [mRNA]  locus=s11:580984:585037:+ [translate_table: standard]